MKNFPTHSVNNDVDNDKRETVDRKRESEIGRVRQLSSLKPFLPSARCTDFFFMSESNANCVHWLEANGIFPIQWRCVAVAATNLPMYPSSSYPSAQPYHSAHLSPHFPSPSLLLTLCHFGSQRNASSYVCNVVRLLASEDAPLLISSPPLFTIPCVVKLLWLIFA